MEMSEPVGTRPELLRVFGGIAAIIPGAAWVWFSARGGHDPSVWVYVVLGLGAATFAVFLVEALFAEPSDNQRTVVLLVVTSLIVGGGWFWAKRQVNPVARSVAAACRGTGIPDAGEFVEGGPGPFHLAVLNDDGGRSRYSNLEADWRADSVADTELVACTQEKMVLLQTCRYTDNSTLERKKHKISVRVVEARTGNEIGTFRLSDTPRECPNHSEGTYSLDGEVPFEMLSAELMPYVNGEVDKPARSHR